MDDRLYRSVDDRMLAGVAGGVAERLDADPSIIRVVWALLVVLTGGLALVAYIVMAIVVPDAPDDEPGRQATDAPPPSPAAAATDPDPDAPTAATTLATAGLVAGTAASTDPVPLASTGTQPASGTTGGWVAPNGQTVARASEAPASRKRRSGMRDGDDRGALIGGMVLILIGGFFLIRQFIPAIDLGSWWPLILVGIGVVLVIMSVSPGRKSG